MLEWFDIILANVEHFKLTMSHDFNKLQMRLLKLQKSPISNITCRQTYVITLKPYHSAMFQTKTILASEMSVITFLWSLFRSCLVWWHIECKWHFIHVHDEVHREVVLLTVINDGPMKSDDFLFIIVRGFVVPESLLFRKPWHQWFLALKVSLRNVIFLIIGKFEGFQSHKGWKNRKSVVSLLNNLCQEINLQLQPHKFFLGSHASNKASTASFLYFFTKA